jgi:hypothetical protein
MVKGILKYRIRHHKNLKDGWLLSDGGMQEVVDDFNLINDFYFGQQKKEVEKWNKTYGEIFLSEEQKAEQKTLTGTPEEKAKWLAEKAEPKLHPIWYLVVSICRLVQGSDYTFPADEAYWLGFIDEVAGGNLPSIRMAEENTPPAK